MGTGWSGMGGVGLLVGGRYRMDAKIGEGGMGAVYRAVDAKTGRVVALKLLLDANESADLDGIARAADGLPMSMRGVWVGGGAFGLVVMTGMASCTAGTGGSTIPGVSSTESSYCDSRDARSRACSPDTGVSVTVDAGPTTSRACAEDFRCVVAIYAVPDAYLNCRTNPDCSASTSSSTCAAKAAEGRTNLDLDACLKKRADCKAAGSKTFDDDTCKLIPALLPSLAQKLTNCLQMGCEQIEGCFKSVGDQIPQCD